MRNTSLGMSSAVTSANNVNRTQTADEKQHQIAMAIKVVIREAKHYRPVRRCDEPDGRMLAALNEVEDPAQKEAIRLLLTKEPRGCSLRTLRGGHPKQ